MYPALGEHLDLTPGCGRARETALHPSLKVSALVRNNEFLKIPSEGLSAGATQDLFACLVERCKFPRQILRINHVVGIFEQFPVILLKRCFSPQLETDLLGLLFHPS